MTPDQFLSWLEGILAAQEKETKLSKAIAAKLKQVSREEEWTQPYLRPEKNLGLSFDLNLDKPYC